MSSHWYGLLILILFNSMVHLTLCWSASQLLELPLSLRSFKIFQCYRIACLFCGWVKQQSVKFLQTNAYKMNPHPLNRVFPCLTTRCQSCTAHTETWNKSLMGKPIKHKFPVYFVISNVLPGCFLVEDRRAVALPRVHLCTNHHDKALVCSQTYTS